MSESVLHTAVLIVSLGLCHVNCRHVIRVVTVHCVCAAH